MSAGYQALREGAAWLDLASRGRILARGRDRARLLHNISTNDVKRLTPGSGCYAFLLNPQGRIQSDLEIFCFAEHFLLATEPEMRERAVAHIRRYIIADQVELEDVTAATSALAVEGPRAAAVLEALGAPVPAADYGHLPWGEITVAAASVTGQPGFRFFLPTADFAALASRLEAAGAVPATPEDARLVRIENGKPRYGEDIRDTSLPQETQQMHGVSFTKGCYLGQEIVERIRARSHVNRKLERLELDAAELPAPGTKLAVEGGEAEVTSAVYSPNLGKVVALAYVRAGVAHP
jgi:folate-binding protein YgfZ